MGTNLTSIGITTNAIGFGSKASGGGVILPPELAAKIVCVCSAWGKNNNSSDRDIVKDKTGNGNDFLLSGFDYTTGSGYSSYATDYMTWTTNLSNVPLSERTTTKFTGYNNDSAGQMAIYKNLSSYKNIIPAFKIKVTNLKHTIRYYYISPETPTTRTSLTISSNGTYALPASRNDLYTGEGTNIGFAFDGNGGGATIEQIPEFEGALVTDGVDDFIQSKNTVTSMIGNSGKITVVSMIGVIGPMPKYPDSRMNANCIRTNGQALAMRTTVSQNAIGQTGIFGYQVDGFSNGSSTAQAKSVTTILGDKNNYATQGGTYRDTDKFYVVGYDNSGTPAESFSVAWYWTFIANDILTQDEINQVIAAYNLDNPGKVVKPQVYYNVAKQKINNDNHNEFGDKLLDYSGNGYDLQLYNFAWEKQSGVGSYPISFKDYTYVTSRAIVQVNKDNFIITANSTTGNFLEINTKNKTLPTYKVRVEGTNTITNGVLSYRFNNTEGVISRMSIPEDGEYEIPESPATVNSIYSGWCINGGVNDNLNIKITLLPTDNIDDALCLDGVDDYGKVSGLSILKDYTVVADYQRLSAKENSQDAPILSKSKIQGSGAFIFNFLSSSGNIVTYSFGANSTLGADDLKKNIYYQSKYINNGKSIIAGTAIDYSEMWLGTYRDNTSNCFNGAFYFSMLFPYSLSEFLLERQIKKLKAGTLYPGMVEWRPFIVANGEYSINHYEYTTDNVNWTTFNPGDYIPVGSTVVIWINTPNGNVDEVTSVKINGKDAPKYNYSEEYGYGFTYTVTTKIPQKINIYMDAYIAYEDIIHPYPSQVSLQYNSKKYTWGDKIKVGTQVTVSFENLLSDLCTVEGYKLNGEELTSSKVAIQKEMVFDYNTVNWNLQAPLFVYNPALIKLNNTGLKRLQKLPDISGNRNDLLLYNMTFEPNSGLGEYLTDFNQNWILRDSTLENQTVTYTRTTEGGTFFINIPNSVKVDIPSFSVYVDYVSSRNPYYYYWDETGVRQFVSLTKGVNVLPANYASKSNDSNLTGSGFHSSYDETVTIKQIPANEEVLYFDGVTDYGTIPTLTAGGKSLLMKMNNKTLGTIVYDQRNHSVEDAPFALYTGSDTTAYNYRNPNGTTYLDNLVNSNARGNKLVDVPSVVTMSNDLVTTENSASPCIGKSRAGSSAYYSQFALYNSVLFPEVLNAADRAKINEWSGITGNFVKFNPIITSNIPYNMVMFFDVNTGQQIGNFPKALLKGQQVQLNIQVKDSELNEVSKIIVNGVELELYSKDEEFVHYRFTVEETQVVDITIDEYIRYEDIVQPYPILFNLTDKDNTDKVYTYGDKIKLNSIIKVKSVVNKVINLYSIHGYLINDDPTIYSYNQIKNADILVIKNLTFNCNRNWLLSSVPEPLYIYDPSMIDNTGLKNLGYLPDMTGRGNHLVLNNFAYSKMSGKNGYLFDFATIITSAIKASYTEDTLVLKKKDEVNRWIVTFGKPTEDFDLYISGDFTGKCLLEYSLNGRSQGNVTVIKDGWTAVPVKNDIEYDNIYLNVPSDYNEVSIKQKAYYDGALCFDGIDDYGTVPTLDYGGKSLFMKVNWDTFGRFVYDQRATVNIYDLAVYIHSQPEGTKIPAYQVRNQNGYTYIDGVLNKYIIPDNLVDKTHVFEAGNAGTTNDNSATPNIGRAVSGQSYAKMAMYKTMLLPEIPNDEDRAIINDWCGIEGGYVKKPSYYWDVYGKTNSTTDEADPHTQIKEQVRWQQGISQSNMFLRNNNFAYEGMSGYGGYPVVLGTNKTWDVIRANGDGNWAYELSSNKVTVTKSLRSSMFTYKYYYLNGTPIEFEIPSFRVKISGIQTDQYVTYYYISETKRDYRTALQITKDGEYTMPKSWSVQASEETGANGNNYVGWVVGVTGDCNITIEILPEYPNGLVFDGIDDYSNNTYVPGMSDFTVIAKRKDLKTNYGLLIHKGPYIDGGAEFVDSLTAGWTGDDERYYSYGKSAIVTSVNSDIVYYTKTSFNGLPVTPGTNEGGNGLEIAKWGSDYKSMVFYKMFLYPKTIDMLSINMVKNMFETDGIIDLSNKLFDTTVSRDFSNDFNNDFNN
jgi:hypothetical protein|nr:MAG TPA: hypothetical protein [Caudoviricetes sp.]